MKQEVTTSIVLVNFNQFDYTAQCIDSILANPPSHSFEIVLVDNASADNSINQLKARYPQVEIVRSPKNLGIAGGNNLGIKAGKSKYVLILNNDTIVIPGAIDYAVHFLDKNPHAAGAGGNLINPDGSYQATYNDFPNLFYEFLNVTKLGYLIRPEYPSYPIGDAIQEIDWMGTTFMLFRRDALEQVGFVDEMFFIYSDDTDLEYRLIKAGWKIYYLPQVTTIHFGGKSLKPWISRPLKYRGILLFFSKHKSLPEIIGIRVMFVLASLIKLVFWGLAFFISKYQNKATNEFKSHLAILKLSILPIKQGLLDDR
jgi:N-acetylglucosaminyl-diphospho-decaprenol L-rhamnosyltransferase